MSKVVSRQNKHEGSTVSSWSHKSSLGTLGWKTEDDSDQ